jgi:CMP/dCMP kinase
MAKGFIIAIDGPVAAGKGTIASKLAAELQGFNLWTGAVYRSIALYCIEHGLDMRDEVAVASTFPNITMRFAGDQVFLNDVDVTDRIKKPDTSAGSSIVAAQPRVREFAVQLQQEIGHKASQNGQIVVSEGRDTATKVFPDAALKLYLTASDEVRAARRLEQFTEKNISVTLEEVVEQIRTRDEQDMNREINPLPRYPEKLGYVILDNSELNEKETLDAIKSELKKRNLL